MRGIIRLIKEKEENKDKEEVEQMTEFFYFRKKDVASFNRNMENIELFLYHQGRIFIDYDEEIYEQLKAEFNA